MTLKKIKANLNKINSETHLYKTAMKEITMALLARRRNLKSKLKRTLVFKKK